MHQRMLEVCHEFDAMDQKERARSCSLPIPDLNILMAGASTPTPAPGHSIGAGHSSHLSNVGRILISKSDFILKTERDLLNRFCYYL